ncbi:hypothetical protein [Chlorobium phaeobacteroides]|uniref:Uncharacterized protein n=1 Tax=Chlorobium phaeobacteroides (strain DSM 266 / SMG 266 / 2430) TaxID=290317 RepID=A1BD57_CHLPD|nr:hypothetical protein [Chlorobium phaeobacteroides]ABL64334.1 hypothetical protein Cpha266_0270 [Chlorobium phaeobacteroides DSM 266]
MEPFIAVISHDNRARLLNNNIALQNIKIVLFQEPSKTGAGKITERQASGAGRISVVCSVVIGWLVLYYFDGSTLFCYTFSKRLLRCV